MASHTGKPDHGERSILRAVRATAKAGGVRGVVRVGIGDDCAVLTPRTGEEMLVTTDFSIEDRHFHLDTHPPEAIGHKCLARGLSDIAAMGGRPMAAFLSLAIPRVLIQPPKRLPKVTRLRSQRDAKRSSWMDRFYAGLLGLAEEHTVTLAGGDLSEAPLAVADIIVIGAAPKGRALLRSTAQDGDLLYVTGTLGGAAAELAGLRAKAGKPPVNNSEHPHFYPQPRVAVGQALRRRELASACIDISDGLSVDLLHLCEESGLSAEIDAASLPIHAGATLEQALHGGDDYELLFTASPHTRVPSSIAGVDVRAIGRMTRGKGRVRMTLLTPGKRSGTTQRVPLQAGGWESF